MPVTAFTSPDRYTYQNGFQSYHETEAVKGALPVGANSPQKPPYGLYAEKLSGTAFTAPRCENLQTWLYRVILAAAHSNFVPRQLDFAEDGPTKYHQIPNRLRWDPFDIDESVDWPSSLRLVAGAGGLDTITTLVAWSIGLLAQRPDIQDKAHKAIEEFYSTKQPLCDALEDQRCKYIVALIPKGSIFFLSAWACNMGTSVRAVYGYLVFLLRIVAYLDDNVWEDPEVFRPERWFEQDDAPFFTYGMGYRMCAGSLLANRELYLIFMRLINSFKIEKEIEFDAHPVSGNMDPTSLVAMPKKYYARFVPRDEAALRGALKEFEVVE
ncbi:hypothetical protein EYB26_004095 [Talaromyces marneffei]|uniref:uncharacterized protein n=1 Tax=Talaromyces marneffei TaxID=37727 RepID=UPI0012A9D1FA|nr:uncharacterized protein EYB26_004095 [Talaromyces marneffei]QGA16428.1 hypothetical protein EYB26_004095 [Talaromyces marneffei]